jgi:hypothetical protein
MKGDGLIQTERRKRRIIRALGCVGPAMVDVIDTFTVAKDEECSS